MIQRAILCLLLTGNIGMTVFAQTPKYYCGYATAGGSGYDFANGNTLDTVHGSKFQCIYYPSDFGAAPSGLVTYVWFRVAGHSDWSSPKTYANWTVKMGYTSKMSFKPQNVRDTFITGLSPVFISPNYMLPPGTDSTHKWFKMNAGSNFYYDHTKNFVVELAYGPPSTVRGISLSNNAIVNATRTLAGNRDTAYSTSSVHVLDFGFDLAPTGVNALSNITSFGMFPNPAPGGRFNVSFDARQVVKEASIRVTDVTGREVFRQVYPDAGNSFFKEIDLGEASKGIYFMQLTADGERVSRRLVIQ